jgi:dienelactone hydrolase
MRLAVGLALAGAMLASASATPPAAAQGGEPDCTGPAGNPDPGTAEWERRENDNVYCAGQRNSDHASNPAYQQALLMRGDTTAIDPYRDPELHQGSRFRYEEISVTAAGKSFSGYLFRPCDASCTNRPPGLRSFQPPYPGVVIMHGGAANQEMYFWGAQALAEAGYMVVTVGIGRTENNHDEATKAALDYLTSPANPRFGELDRRHIGLAGHSAGGVAVSTLGQEDPRVSAIVSWDRAQSSPMPADLRLRTPALFLVADFNCQRVPVCLPERRSTPPDPYGPGNKDEDFQRLSGADIESMKIALRAATHLDFTEWPEANGSRYGVTTTVYYTLAWFDRYLKGDDDLRRLITTRFDDSADVHNVSGGRRNPQTQGNLPAFIAGQPVADRLSFHFRSAYYFRGGAIRCENIRAGCDRGGRGAGARGCLSRRSPVGPRNIGRVRLGLTRGLLARRLPAPQRRTRRSWRWCAKGGRGTVSAAFSRRGRVVLVATTAPRHGNRGIRPGARLGALSRAYPRRRSLGGGLYLAARRSRRLVGVRRGRVRFVAVASSGLIRNRRALRAHLRYAGVDGKAPSRRRR